MVTSLKTSEKKGGNRGSKSVTSLSSFFKVFFTPARHEILNNDNMLSLFKIKTPLINYLSLDILFILGGNYIFSFSSITANLHVKHFFYKRSVMKCPLNKGSRSYSTNSSPTIPSFQPVKVYLNADEDKLIILKENKGKCGVYR